MQTGTSTLVLARRSIFIATNEPAGPLRHWRLLLPGGGQSAFTGQVNMPEERDERTRVQFIFDPAVKWLDEETMVS